jgi:hypothetical protein
MGDETVGQDVQKEAANESTGNQPTTLGKDLRPREDAHRFPQPGWPKWVGLHQGVDLRRIIGFDQP